MWLIETRVAAWYPNYLTSTSFDLDSRQLPSTSAELREWQLDSNKLTSLNASLFNGLSQLHCPFIGLT